MCTIVESLIDKEKGVAKAAKNLVGLPLRPSEEKITKPMQGRNFKNLETSKKPKKAPKKIRGRKEDLKLGTIRNYFSPVDKDQKTGGEMRFLEAEKTPPKSPKMTEDQKNFWPIKSVNKNGQEKSSSGGKKVGGGPEKLVFPKLGPNLLEKSGTSRPFPAKKLAHAAPTNEQPAWTKDLPARNSHLTAQSVLSKLKEIEEDWTEKRGEGGGEGGRKRRRSGGEKEGRDLGHSKRLKKGKLLEDLKKLNGVRRGMRLRLESEKNQTPSVALFCQKIDRQKKPTRNEPQNDLKSGGVNSLEL